jgi:hypothetical protein|tara:strand:- start:307 stop:567 length:261 start_codon:yes stop_codon:yes gene_type:complete
MEKIIFFTLALPILGFVFYLGGTAIMKGFKAKVDNRPDDLDKNETSEVVKSENDLSSEIKKLNELYQNGVLTKDEFDKAKNKLLNS